MLVLKVYFFIKNLFTFFFTWAIVPSWMPLQKLTSSIRPYKSGPACANSASRGSI